MKKHIKFIVCLTALIATSNITPAQPAESGSGGGSAGLTKAKAAAKAENANEREFERVEGQLAAQQERMNALNKSLGAGQKSWAISGGSADSASRSLAILQDGADSKSIEDCEEDLNVMARILEKAASQRTAKGHNAMGIVVHTSIFGDSAAPRNLYLDGYGALFILNVNYPLVAPPATPAAADSKEEKSSEWEETRRELYQPSTPSPGFTLPSPPLFGSGPAEEYDASKVENLKQNLIAALKNAAHIRRLKPDEIVTIVVNGRSGGSETKVVTKQSNGGGSGGGSGGSGSYSTRVESKIRRASDGRGSKLVLRARKSDLEAFQNDKLTAEEFSKKVTVQVY